MLDLFSETQRIDLDKLSVEELEERERNLEAIIRRALTAEPPHEN